jgi:L-threonylcarbamoyladenylate synthase
MPRPLLPKTQRYRKSSKTDNASVTDWTSNPQVSSAVQLLRQQAVIAYPTESVWGLGCNPWSREAVTKLLKLKNRSVDKGLILIAADSVQLQPFLEGLTPPQLQRFQTPQKKPTTWLVSNNGHAPEWITGGHDTLALRITDHPLAAALCRLFGGPLVSTSANLQGQPAAISAGQVRSYFAEEVDFVTPGEVGGAAKPSEIRYLATGEVVREG